MSPRQAFTLIMAMLYIIIGSTLLFSHTMDRLIPRYRPAVGGVLLAYGILRLAIWWRRRQAARDGR